MNVIIEKRGKQDQDFDAIQWVLKARSKDDTRVNITGVNVSSGVFCCTDGHRLHAAARDIHEVPDGNYFIKSSNKSIIVLELNDYDFPDYERVFPVFKPTHKASYNGDKSAFARDVYRRFAADDIGFNLDYLLDTYVDDMTVEFSGGGVRNKPLVIWDERQDRAAIVMPLNG